MPRSTALETTSATFRRIAPDLRVALQESLGEGFIVCEGGSDGDGRADVSSLEQLAEQTGRSEWLQLDGRDWSRLLGQARSSARSVVQPLGGGTCAVVIPFRTRLGRQRYAAGLVAARDPDLVRQLADTAVRNVRLRRRLRRRRKQLDAYADRVTRDFEELWWLRKLAESIEYCEASSGPEAVAVTLLPSLREIIEAEAVALIPEALLAPGAAGGAGFCRAGSLLIPDDICVRIINAFEQAPGPVVKNDLAAVPDLAAAGLRSFVLVPVARGDWRFGWLLALNKTVCSEPAPAGGGHTAGLSEPEFGSFETGLLGAAAVMLAAHARNADLFRQRELLLIGVIRTLVNAIDAKDAYTCGHSDRVARIAMRLAAELGLDHQICLQVYMTGLLHDVGKIGVPDAILCKPGKLTDEEFAIVKRHPAIGYQILRHLEQLSYVLPGVLHHHEAMTGTGYPLGLAGESIPLAARILAVADSYDAMTSSRPYREAMPFERAEAIIQEGSGQQWDAQVIAALFRALNDVRAICIDSESRQQIIHQPSGDGLELPPEAFAERMTAPVAIVAGTRTS